MKFEEKINGIEVWSDVKVPYGGIYVFPKKDINIEEYDFKKIGKIEGVKNER